MEMHDIVENLNIIHKIKHKPIKGRGEEYIKSHQLPLNLQTAA